MTRALLHVRVDRPQPRDRGEDVVCDGLLLLAGGARTESFGRADRRWHHLGGAIAQRLAEAHAHAREVEPLPVASALRAVDGHRHDRCAALEGEAPDARPCPIGDRAAAGATALRVDDDDAPTGQYRQRRAHRLLVALSALHREGSAVAQDPCQRPPEELGLRHEPDAPAQVHGDEEVVERREVVGSDDHRPARRNELRVDRARAVDEHADRHDEEADEVLHPVGSVRPRPGVR